jgi:hypothetical protein
MRGRRSWPTSTGSWRITPAWLRWWPATCRTPRGHRPKTGGLGSPETRCFAPPSCGCFHPPDDAAQLYDVVRVLVRLLRKAEKLRAVTGSGPRCQRVFAPAEHLRSLHSPGAPGGEGAPVEGGRSRSRPDPSAAPAELTVRLQRACRASPGRATSRAWEPIDSRGSKGTDPRRRFRTDRSVRTRSRTQLPEARVRVPKDEEFAPCEPSRISHVPSAEVDAVRYAPSFRLVAADQRQDARHPCLGLIDSRRIRACSRIVDGQVVAIVK